MTGNTMRDQYDYEVYDPTGLYVGNITTWGSDAIACTREHLAEKLAAIGPLTAGRWTLRPAGVAMMLVFVDVVTEAGPWVVRLAGEPPENAEVRTFAAESESEELREALRKIERVTSGTDRFAQHIAQQALAITDVS